MSRKMPKFASRTPSISVMVQRKKENCCTTSCRKMEQSDLSQNMKTGKPLLTFEKQLCFFKVYSQVEMIEARAVFLVLLYILYTGLFEDCSFA